MLRHLFSGILQLLVLYVQYTHHPKLTSLSDQVRKQVFVLTLIIAMMTYVYAQAVLLRMPALKTSDYTLHPQQHLQSAFFRCALWLASPVFYEQLVKKDFDYERLAIRERYTLAKYLNRVCFRPTPFGLFASVTLLRWDTKHYHDPDARLKAVISPNQEWQVAFEGSLDFEIETEKYTVNPLLYRQLDEYRFIRTDVVDGKRNYLLQSIACSPVLQAIFGTSVSKPAGLQLQELIVQQASCTEAEAKDFLQFLIDAQILLCVSRPGETGAPAIPPPFDLKPFTTINRRSSIPAPDLQPELLIRTARQLNDALPFSRQQGLPLGTILVRQATQESLPQQWQTQISDGLQAIAALTTPAATPAMELFTTAFRKRYEDEQVPLLKALDPETGIAYGDSGLELTQPLLETMDINVRRLPGEAAQWTPAHTFLMQQWQAAIRQGMPVIRLEQEGIDRLSAGKDKRPILGLSVLFRTAGYELWLEAAGGVNAPALAGRFTSADAEIHEACQVMARQTESLYPEHLFAELLHLADPHTDNVNVRESIWSYEIPITCPSTLPETQQIPLSDLTLQLSGKQLLLWSVSRQRVVIPRLSSAYNHHLNQLPLFRFLADLPYQYVRSDFHFELKTLFPGLSYYPRVCFKSTILQPATWILNQSDLDELRRGPELEAGTRLRKLSGRLSLPAIFYTGDGDRQMVIRPKRDTDADLFLHLIRSKTEVIVQEAPDQSADEKDQGSQAAPGYVQQFNAFVLPDDPDALPIASPIPVSKAQQRKFLPGSKWLYLKISIPRTLADRLLLRIRPLIYRRYPTGKVRQWFFVRYEETAPHIRLRLLVEPQVIPELLEAFRKKLQHEVFENVIREYQVDTYAREIERYAAGGMRATEHFFWKSSELIICFMRLQADGNSLPVYRFAMLTAALIVNHLLEEQAGPANFYRQSYLQFLPEFESPSLQKGLDQRYRQLRPDLNEQLNDESLTGLDTLKKAFRQYIRSLRSIDLSTAGLQERQAYIRSLVHLHLNRLFTDQARRQEMIIYYFLYKQSRSAAARVR